MEWKQNRKNGDEMKILIFYHLFDEKIIKEKKNFILFSLESTREHFPFSISMK